MPFLQQSANAFQRGDYAAALEFADRAFSMAPDHPEALHMRALTLGRLGRVNEALPLFRRAAQVHPQKHAILANMGNALKAAERYDEAAIAYEQALASQPDFLAALVNLGAVYFELKRYDDALAVLNRAEALAPGDADVQNNLGNVLAAKGDDAGALGRFDAALTSDPQSISARINRGATRRNLGDFNGALDDHRGAAAAAPNNVNAEYELGNSYRFAGDIQAAADAYLRAIKLAPHKFDLHKDLASTLWELGVGESFLDPLNRVLAQTPSADLFGLKASMAYRAALPAIAEHAALAGLQIDPLHSLSGLILARVRRHEGDRAAAIDLLKSLFGRAPQDFAIIHDLAETYIEAGEAQNAADLLDRPSPRDTLQRHIALKTTALRMLGDESYQIYYDYERFVRRMTIETPPGYENLAAFNAELAAAIRALHKTKTHPIDQTLYGGTQSFGRLWDNDARAIQAMQKALLSAAGRYVDALPDDPNHPFLSSKTKDLSCAGAWSVILASGGGHVDHFHPEGWISASYYVQVPEIMGESPNAGCLRLGRPPFERANLGAQHWVKPAAGTVVFFPSYMWHGVEPFQSAEQRITAPFDLAPRQIK